MPTLKDLLCRPECQRPFILKGAAALNEMKAVPITPALYGKVAAAEEKATTAALKPCDVVRTSVLPPHPPWDRIAGYFQQIALTESSSAVLTFAVLSLLLLFPAAVAEVQSETPVNYAPFFTGSRSILDMTSRFERHLTGTQSRPAKLPIEILVCELQLYRRLTPTHMQ